MGIGKKAKQKGIHGFLGMIMLVSIECSPYAIEYNICISSLVSMDYLQTCTVLNALIFRMKENSTLSSVIENHLKTGHGISSSLSVQSSWTLSNFLFVNIQSCEFKVIKCANPR